MNLLENILLKEVELLTDLIKCPHCGKLTDASIPICTNCGLPITDDIELSTEPKEEKKITEKVSVRAPIATSTKPEVSKTSKSGTIVPVKALEKALKGEHIVEEETTAIEIESPFTPIDESELPSDEVLESAIEPIGEHKQAIQDKVSAPQKTTTGEDIEFEIEEPIEEGIPVSAASVTSTITCPRCGHIYTPDNFEYPDYVYEAMGKARIEAANALMKEKKFTEAIELLNKAKRIYEHASNEDGIKTTNEKITDAYVSLGEIYRKEGEKLLKNKQYEEAIEQFNIARDYYIKAEDNKRIKNIENKIRETYEKAADEYQKQAEQYAKRGDRSNALNLYQKAIDICLKINDTKTIRDIEKKMRKI